jgi:membrane peptidoglycan carboxypeptidase
MSGPRSDATATAPSVLSHLGVMAAVAAVMGVVVAGLAIPFAAIIGLGANDISRSLNNLPADLEATALPQKTRILDAEGNLIAQLYDENRVNVPLTHISRTMVQAIVSIEDYRFYSHGALDVKGTLRALVTNNAAGGTVQGGSSITQQLVKNMLIQQAEGDKQKLAAATANTYARKINELRYAVALERRHSKDWILEQYLNIAYFGDGAFGVQAAARHYFNVNASKLNLRQAATLAGLVKNPTGYDPTNYPDRAIERRNVVIDRMAQLNVISASTAAQTKKQGLGLKVQPANNGCVYSRAPWFCDYVLNYLMQDDQLGATAEERRKLLYSGGLTIRTTVDLRFQQAADKSVASHIYPTDNAIGGLAEVEPGTGDVKALAQSRPMGRDRRRGQTFLNYVVPAKYGDSNGFQAGSTFKAFVLATAIAKDIPLTQTFFSPPEKIMPYSAYKDCDNKPLIGGVWDVHNSTTSGTKNMYTGTRESVNTYFAQLEAMTGVCEPYKLAKLLGVHLTDPTNQMVPSFTLGVIDTDPLTMASAYATWAARGLYCKPRPVTGIEDSAGNVLKEYPKFCQQVLPSAVADAINDILRGVQEGNGFGAINGLGLDKPSAAKTGTTTGNKAVWFIGYTPALATASMVAGANEQGQPISLNGQVLGGRYTATAHGSTTAGPMWGGAMHAIMDLLPNDDFVPPAGSEISGVLKPIPDVDGMTVDQARKVLTDAGFSPALGGYVNSSYAYGDVAYTYPSGGSQFSSGDVVTIYQSNGTPPPVRHGGKKGGKGKGR